MVNTKTQGIALFAYNTTQIDYIKLSSLAARYVKAFMPGYPVSLITDQGTWDWSLKEHKELKLVDVFDEIVITPEQPLGNERTHYDSPWSHFVSDFKNGNKHKVFNYTPYDQTLLIDIDYIIQNNDLEYVFSTSSPVTLFHYAENLVGESPPLPQINLHEAGIPMVWSTVIYFDKNNPVTKLFFDLWGHISENYEFYKFLYGFPGKIYRTDYCVSIAKHILNGSMNGEIIDDFKSPLINMNQTDGIAKINGLDDWIYIVNNSKENWKDSLTRITKENVHVMNKRALDREYNTLTKLLDKNK